MNILAGVDCSNYSKLKSCYRNLEILEFSYGDASISGFSKSTEGWIGRKVTAIPLAAAAIVKAVYHLSMAILEGLKGCCSQDTHAKMYAFCAVRGLEESLGRFLTLFSDNVGCYLVEESAYQKTCYFLASNKIEGFSSSEIQPYLKFLSSEVLAGLSGEQLQGLDLSGLDSLDFERMFTSESDGQFTKETRACFANLLAGQIQPCLQSLKGAGLFEILSGEQLQGLDLSGLDYWDFDHMFPRDSAGQFAEETKARFANLSAAQIQPVLDELIAIFLPKLISKKQLQGLDLSGLGYWDFFRLFPRDSAGRFVEETKTRFAYLSAAQFQYILPSLDQDRVDYLFQLISKEQIQRIEWDNIQIDALFNIFSVSDPKQASKNLFYSIDSEETREKILGRIEKSCEDGASSFRSYVSRL